MSEPAWTRPDAAATPPLVFDDPEDGFDWRHAAKRLWSRRTRLVVWSACGALVGIGLSFVLPPVYVSKVTLMEAGGRSTLASPLMSLVSEQLPFQLGARPSAVNTYPEIVRSRQLLGRVLSARYPTRRSGEVLLLDRLVRASPEPQRTDVGVRRLSSRVDAAVDRRTGILTLRVRMDDPVLAAGVATAVCATLQDILVHTMNTQAGASRHFIEERLADARHALYRAEDALRGFRENNLRGSSPRLLTEEARLLRETRTQEEIVLTLTRQHEIARVEEQQDLPVLNVLDPAVPPAFRSAPRRSAMAALGMILGCVCAAAWVLMRRHAHIGIADGRR